MGNGKYERIDEWMNEWIDCINGWMNGLMDG